MSAFWIRWTMRNSGCAHLKRRKRLCLIGCIVSRKARGSGLRFHLRGSKRHRLPSFQEQFPQPALAVYGLTELDTAFAVLLDSAGAIFGDILPNFRLVGPEDSEEISALLFDLMQQSDQMLVQFEVTLEPLTSLLRYFAAAGEGS